MITGHILSDEEYRFFKSFLPYVYRRTLTASIYLQRLKKNGSASKSELEALSNMLAGSDIYDDLNAMMDMLDIDGHDEFYTKYGGPDESIKNICEYRRVNPYSDED